MINYTSLSKTFEINDKTLKEYINYFEDTFLLKRVDKFHNKQKEIIKSFKKVYALDNGFLQIAPKFSKDLGSNLENMVYIVLNQKSEYIYYLKELQEIDFFNTKNLYQVSFDISDEKTKQREINAFSYFNDKNKYKNILITYDTNMTLEGVEVVSFEKFIFSLSL